MESKKKKVGALEIRNFKKLWETIAQELNKLLKTNYSASQCENKWRVLERGYKKFVDNKNKTGRGRKFFEYAEEMDIIFQKKRNVHPVLLLSSTTVTPFNEEDDGSSTSGLRLEVPRELIPSAEPSWQNEYVSQAKPTQSTPGSSQQNGYMTPKKKNFKSTIITRNKIIDEMRRDRAAYYKERLAIEREKLEVEKQKVEELKKEMPLSEREMTYCF